MKPKNFMMALLMSMPLLLASQELSWITQDPGLPEDYRISHIHALTQNHVWVTANDISSNHLNVMYSVTIDGGTTWQTDTIEGTGGLRAAMIFGFGSIPPAYAVLYKYDATSTNLPGIYYTADYGQNWARKEGAFEDAASFPDIIHFWSEGARGVAIGDPVGGEFEIYTILEYGDSISLVAPENIPDPLEGENALVRTYGVSGNTIWFSTSRARLFRSDDEGLTWMAYSTLFDEKSRILVADPDTVYLQTIPNWETTQFARTTDAAYSWQEINFNGRLLNFDLKKIPNRNVFVSSGAFVHNGFSYSCDQGQNWHSMNDTDEFFVMDWYDDINGWVGGETQTENRGTKPIIYKYDGPGIGSYFASTLKYDYGEVEIDEIVAFDLTLTNEGSEPVVINDITTSTAEFFTGIVSCTIETGGGQCVVSVAFAPGTTDFFEGDLTIFSNHPDLPELTISLSGSGVIPADPFTFDPEFFDETLTTGEKKSLPQNFTNDSPYAFGWQAEVDYDLPLQSLGWQNGSTPLGADDGILGAAPDWAMFIKEIEVNTDFNEAFLRLGFDDGIRVWVNGTFVFGDLFANNPVLYWNQEIDITEFLLQGTNRIAVVVFNGVFNGGGDGGFDCELEVDEQMLIKRGDENYGTPEALWFYYGETLQQLSPPTDIEKRNWWEKDYGNQQWLLLNQYQGDAVGNEFTDLGWNYWSAPFGNNESLLYASPDNAFFIKDFDVPSFENATLYLSFDDGCQVYINGNLAFDYQYDNHGPEYWNAEHDVSGWLTEGRNRISIVVFNGMYGGCCAGYFDCQLLIDGVEIIKRGDFNQGAPEAHWYVYGQAGQVLTPPDDFAGRQWFEMDYGLREPVLTSSLGWNYNSTPINDNPDLLYSSPDIAQFIKDVEIGTYTETTLYLAFDDGCRVWINGLLEFDFHNEVHGLNYWDQEIDVSGILQNGRNRIAIEVYNGIYGGGAYGGFDCQLIVDGVELIKRGDQNYGVPEAMWYMYGESGKILTPPDDANGFAWYHKDYGLTANLASVFVEGVIQAWQTEQIMVLFDACGLSAGDYSAIIRFTNTGTMEVAEVPVDLHVMGGAKLAVNPNTLDFSDYFIGFPETQKVKITNQGDEALEIFTIYPLRTGISVFWDEFYVEPLQSIYMDIMIDLSEFGPFNAAVVIECNDPLMPYRFVQISAEVKNAPDIDIPNVEYLFAVLEPDQTDIQNVPIYNSGSDPSLLHFTIPQASGAKASINPATKAVPDIGNNNIQHSGKEGRNRRKSNDLAGVAGYRDCSIGSKDVMSRNGNEVIIFSDNMESGENGWSVENYMETESQWHLANYFSNSPDHAWWCGNELTGTYWNQNRVAEAIISPSILLPPSGNQVFIEFAEYYEVEGDYDQLCVDLSTDGGENWWRIREGATGWSNGWITTILDISVFSGNEVLIRFLIDTGDDIANDFMGWFVDDLRVYSPEFSFLSIGPAEATVLSGEYQNMNATFDATGYDPGFYVGYFLIRSNDPDESYYYLPAHMEVAGVLAVNALQNISVSPVTNPNCFPATLTVVTAGDGTYFIAEENSEVYLIAGENVLLRDGTHLQYGSYVHAYIDLEGNFCNNPRSIVAADSSLPESKNPYNIPHPEMFLQVYPNPTSGLFMLRLMEITESVPLYVEVFNATGVCTMRVELPPANTYQLDLSGKQPGIYFVRVKQGLKYGVVKVVKQ